LGKQVQKMNRLLLTLILLFPSLIYCQIDENINSLELSDFSHNKSKQDDGEIEYFDILHNEKAKDNRICTILVL